MSGVSRHSLVEDWAESVQVSRPSNHFIHSFIVSFQCASSSLQDRSGSELKTSFTDCSSENTRQDEESGVETRSKGILRYSSPLPMYKWVLLVDPADESTLPLSYNPCSACGCSKSYQRLEVPVHKQSTMWFRFLE